MQEQLSEVLFFAKGTLKYKWVIIIIAWLMSGVGWFYISTMPDEYESKAIVNVDSATMLRPLIQRMTVQSDTRGLIDIMRQLMFTRPKLERVAKLANINLDSKTEAEKQPLIEELKESIEISGGRDDLFSISYSGHEAKQAQSVVHAVLTVFSEQAQQRGISDTGSAQQFIEEQIREYEVRLRNAEKARENFLRVNSDLMPNEGGGHINELSRIKDQLQTARLELSEVSSREVVLQRQISEALQGAVVNPVDRGNSVSTPEDAKIAELEERMNELLLRFTPNYPDVISIKIKLSDLQKVRQIKLGKMSDDPNVLNSGAMANPYIQTLKLSLNEVETEKASILSRVGVLNHRIKDIEEGMDSRLRLETEMQNMDRDYTIIKENYLNLIESREKAAMTAKADRNQGVLKFKIVDAPSVPVEPSGPNRKLLNSISLIVGLLVGSIFAFLIYFVRPTYMSTRQVRALTGLPVLGIVSVQLEEGGGQYEKYQKKFFWFFAFGLVLTYIAVMIIV